MALLDDVKLTLRISNTAYDAEINDLIQSATTDLALAGVIKLNEIDVLIKRAITVYVKANFGWDNPDAERLHRAYEMLKNHLSMSTDYSYHKVTINANSQSEVTFDGVTKQTNESGTVIFYCRDKNHVEYTVNGVTGYIDVLNDVVIGG